MQPLLEYIGRYVQLTPEEVTVVKARFNRRRYLKGQYIVQQGDVCKYESFVVAGCTKTFYVDQEGNEHIVMFAIEDWWTADMGSFITRTPADFNVQCLENTEVIQIDYDNLEALYQEVPKMERFFRIIIQKALVAANQRIIRNFSLPAKDRYLQFRGQYPQIEQRVPQYMIASYLGMSGEFLSKIRGKLISEQ